MKFPQARLFAICASLVACVIGSSVALSQPPRNGGRGPGGPGGPNRVRSNAASTADAFIAKWLTMDLNSDGQLSRDELKDERLAHLFKVSDKNSDGVLTKDEMKLLFETSSSSSRTDRGGPGPGGRGGASGRGGPGSGEGLSTPPREVLK